MCTSTFNTIDVGYLFCFFFIDTINNSSYTSYCPQPQSNTTFKIEDTLNFDLELYPWQGRTQQCSSGKTCIGHHSIYMHRAPRQLLWVGVVAEGYF